MKVVENSPQNVRNCTFIKNFLGGGMPPNPPSKGSQLRCSRHAASWHVYTKFKKFESWASPLRNPAYAPAPPPQNDRGRVYFFA